MLSRYLESCEGGSNALEENATVEEKVAHKELKKDYKVLFIIHQCVDFSNFEKLSDVGSSEEEF